MIRRKKVPVCQSVVPLMVGRKKVPVYQSSGTSDGQMQESASLVEPLLVRHQTVLILLFSKPSPEYFLCWLWPVQVPVWTHRIKQATPLIVTDD